MTPIVPNIFPRYPHPSKRLALIGEAPGELEVEQGQPFVGYSGQLLTRTLEQVGLSRDMCFIGNVCQHRPDDNVISKFAWNGPEITAGLNQLTKDLCQFKPNIVVLLGNVPLKAAKDRELVHLLLPNRFEFKVANWRGSLFQSTTLTGESVKCISTYHPAYVLRDYETHFLFRADLFRAVDEASTSTLELPQRTLATSLSANETLFRLANIRELRTPVAIDIEGGIDSMSCISFATSQDRAFIVPFFKKDGTSCWTADEETLIWRALAQTLEDKNVPKILQNSLYDRFVLHYSYGIRVRNTVDDTMLKAWELFSELPKGLGTLCSIYTREPYYKGDRKSDGDTTFYEYCCRDSAVTYEINDAISSRLDRTPSSVAHYRFNIDLLNPLLYMEMRGIRYDEKLAKDRRMLLQTKLYEAQARLNGLTGFAFQWNSITEITTRARELMCQKKHPSIPKKSHTIEHARLQVLLNQPLTLAALGEIEDLCEVSMNVGSPMFRDYLYETLNLPKQYNDNQPPGLTADYEALLKLSKHLDAERDGLAYQVIRLAIEIRALQTRQQMLGIQADADGRIRCGYNIVGSDTGRITCYTSPTGSGYNLQTIPKYTNPNEAPGGVLGDRDLFLADAEHWFFQCDLEGADGWTVAAYSAMLGDPTMLDDYRAGLRPAKILVLMLEGRNVDFSDREAIRAACKEISKDSWNYFACKRVQHGACLTSDHDVLTPLGWVPIHEAATKNLEIITYNQKTKGLVFEKPKAWNIEYCYTDLYEFEGTAISLKCTESHRIPVNDNGDKVFFASQVINKKSGRIPYSGFYVGGKETVFARLIAAYHADGCWVERTQSMSFHFKKPRKNERLIKLVEEAGISFKSYGNRDGTCIIDVKFNALQNGILKKPGAYMLNWTYKCLEEYVDEIKYWDATISKTSCIDFCSVDKETINWIQTFCHLVGKASVYKGVQVSGFGSLIHSCSVNNREYADIVSLKTKSKTKAQGELVYCPSVSTGFFMYRRRDKIGITGNSYMEGKITISRNIIKDSEGKLFLPPSECEKLKERCFFTRYRGVRLWHNWVSSRIRNSRGTPEFVMASGSVRRLFGRKDEIITKAVAAEPQHNTTYATNLALFNLWTDPDNRVGRKAIDTSRPNNVSQKYVATLPQTSPSLVRDLRDVSPRLRIEPLHQVHDALCGQFLKADTAWAADAIKRYFDNPLDIAGQKITIPYEGAYGDSWGNLKAGVL